MTPRGLLLLGGASAVGLMLMAAAGSIDTAQTTWRQGMDWIDRVIARVSRHEGRHDSLNLNRDGAGLSFEILQWSQKTGNLGLLLTELYRAGPSAFVRIFGPDWNALLAVTSASTPAARLAPVGGALLWRVPWIARFREAGRHPAFVAVQNRLARQGLHWQGAVDAALILGFATERSLALFYDTSVQQGPGFARRHAERIRNRYAGRPYAEVLAAFATQAPTHFRRTTPPTKPCPSSHITWRKTGDEWHAWAGEFDLYTGILRRRLSIVNDPSLTDTPVELS